MNTEKKRVTVLVDPKSVVMPSDQGPFNFTGFQPPSTAVGGGGADAAAASAHHAPPPAASSAAGCNATEGTDEDACVTSYQGGRKSIIEGVGATDLLQMHRKSLAQLGGSSGVAMENFTGVTLSRRHRVTQAEYESGKDTTTAQQLEGFSFGSAE